MKSKWFRKVIGVDEELLAKMPKDDMVWATQLGGTLTLVFVFIWIIIFFSMEYLGVSREVTILDDGSILTHEGRSLTTMVLIAFFALLPTSLIIILDRTIIISDWYHQGAYGEKISFLKRLHRGLSKVFRALPRIVISIGLAYVLSIFLILRAYDGSISKVLKDEYSAANQHIKGKMNDYRKKIELEIEKIKNNISTKRGMITSDSPATLWSEDTMMNELKNELENVSKSLQTSEQTLQSIELSKRYVNWQKLNNDLLKYETLKKLESEVNTGKKSIEIGGELFSISGNEGKGDKFREYQSSLEGTRKQIESFKQVNKDMFEQLKHIREEIKVSRERVAKLNNRLESRREEISNAYGSLREQRIYQLKQELNTSLNTFEKLTKEKDKKIENYKKSLFNSSDYQPYEDGPMVRYVALNKLFEDPKYGETREYFAWLFKGLLVLFEMIPVLMKLFFSPPSAYAVALQERMKRHIEKLKTEGEIHTKESFEEKIKQEEKHMEYIDVLERRRMKEEHYRRYNNKEREV